MYSPHRQQFSVELNPPKFKKLVEVMNKTPKDFLGEVSKKLDLAFAEMETDVLSLARINEAMVQEVERFRKRRDPFADLMGEAGDDDPLARLRSSAPHETFIYLVYDVAHAITDGYRVLRDIVKNLHPEQISLVGDIGDYPTNIEEIQLFQYQLQTHQAALNRFINGVTLSEAAPHGIVELGRGIAHRLDAYYGRLLARHSTEGVKVHGDPISTDIALSIFENVDANGEIQDGVDPDEVSAYSISKAKLIADTIKRGLVGEFLTRPAGFIEFFEVHLTALSELASTLATLVEEPADKIRTILGLEHRKPRKIDSWAFKSAVMAIKDLDPRSITYKEKTGLLTVEERNALEFQNQTLALIVDGIAWKTSEELIRLVLDRKAERRRYEMEENSFYVCQIGSGNPFLGTAPGALSIVPGAKPTVNLDEVVGSGFQQVRDFLGQVEHGAKWHALWIATSPSKRVDKNNVLLVGPQGSGKTEVLRAVASDRKSLGIFAQASDFLTCWKGEAEKNPKRLFEGGLKLQRESGKTVYFLIDEIDTILNGDRGHQAFGGTNLATEFQVLMDGITTYPNLALWGATNHPERIPMPLIRRFAKVVIVGELSQENRVTLLKQFMGVLPISPKLKKGAWEEAAQALDGAVGDIVRKIADHVWRTKMGIFVENNPDEAKKLVDSLNEEGKFDVGNFTSDQRQAFLKKLRPFVEVSPNDLMGSIDVHLGNIAIQQEIATAKATYERSRQFLSGLNAR